MTIRTLFPLLLSLVVFAGCGDKDSEETGHDDDHEDHEDHED